MDERVFLSENGTYVSNTKIVLEGTTYATANVTSVSRGVEPANTGCAVVLMIGSGFLALVSLLASSDTGSRLFGLVFFLGLAAVGFYWLQSLKPTYHVAIASSSGEKRGLASKDEAVINRVVSAINDAITHRG